MLLWRCRCLIPARASLLTSMLPVAAPCLEPTYASRLIAHPCAAGTPGFSAWRPYLGVAPLRFFISWLLRIAARLQYWKGTYPPQRFSCAYLCGGYAHHPGKLAQGQLSSSV